VENVVTDDHTINAHCMLDIQGFKHTLRICRTYCFSTSTMVARTHLNITLYIHCLSCLLLKTNQFVHLKFI